MASFMPVLQNFASVIAVPLIAAHIMHHVQLNFYVVLWRTDLKLNNLHNCTDYNFKLHKLFNTLLLVSFLLAMNDPLSDQ